MRWCRFFRMSLSPESDGWWSGMMRWHAARCPECRERLERERALIDALRRSAPIAPELPSFLKGRILANLERSGVAGAEARPAWRWMQPWAIAAICLFALAVVWPRPDRSGMESGMTVEPSTMDWDAPASWVGVTTPDLVRWTELAGRPLEGEFENALKDGHRLFVAVVQSCVPERAAELILTETEEWMAPRR